MKRSKSSVSSISKDVLDLSLWKILSNRGWNQVIWAHYWPSGNFFLSEFERNIIPLPCDLTNSLHFFYIKKLVKLSGGGNFFIQKFDHVIIFLFKLCHNWIGFNNVSGFNSKVNSYLKNFQLKHPLFLYPTLNFLINMFWIIFFIYCVLSMPSKRHSTSVFYFTRNILLYFHAHVLSLEIFDFANFYVKRKFDIFWKS